MLLPLPDIRSTADHDCGQTAARVVYRSLGVRRPELPKGSPIDGTDPREIERAFRESGLFVLSGEMTLGDLQHHTKHGRPVICLMTEPAGIGHYVVVGAVRRFRVHYHCPGNGPKTEPVPEFLYRWYDSDRTARRYERWGIAAWTPG